MKEPTLHDVLAAIGRVQDTQGQHSGALLEVSDDLKHIRGALAEHTAILGQHTATLGEHTVLLGQHTATLSEHTATLRGHSQSLGRIERQQLAETKSLDDHEVRIKTLERRRKSGRAPKS